MIGRKIPMSNIPFDLEDRIMECWNITNDIKVVYSEQLDSPDLMSDDELANIMIGLEALYNRKFARLFQSYEAICEHGGVFLDKDVVESVNHPVDEQPELPGLVDKQEWDSFFIKETEEKQWGDNVDNERIG
jgi:hypothetical protein|tara:strand:- start:470 stop:865 length:396 start_codon:yes stop_codon:yes gene_type:complete